MSKFTDVVTDLPGFWSATQSPATTTSIKVIARDLKGLSQF
jgi:hypothetical protein